MNNEVLTVQYINVKNCFLHLPALRFHSLIGPTVCGLKLTTNSGRELYFSSSSAPCALLNSDSVGISNTFASVIQLKNEEQVILSPLYNLGSLQSICVTPRSESDFEILQSSASKVESSLLNQLRIVWPHQVFPIWVSANISITLVIDSISPNLKYGRLEEYSEVIVATVLPKNGVRTKSLLQNDLPHPSSSLKENILESKKLKFRCIPICDYPDSKFDLNPYIVLTNKTLLPAWARDAIELNKNAVWRLTKVGDESGSVVVNIAVNDHLENAKPAGAYQHLYLSTLLKNHLSLNLGEKVLLELICCTQLPEVSGILITSSCMGGDLPEEVRTSLSRAVLAQGDVLLNTKAPFPISGSTVLLTLRPLHLTWGFVSLNTLTALSIDVNQFVPETILYSNTSQEGKSHILENICSSFEELLNDGKITLELSLAIYSKEVSKRVCDNVLYTGKSGSGKSWLVTCLLARLSKAPSYIHTEYISCCSLKGKRVEALSKYFSEVLHKCSLFEPSVLCLDDIDLLTSTSEENTEAAFHVKRISHKLAELINAHQKKHSIAIVATAKSLEGIDTHIMSRKGKSLFATVIQIPNLNKHDRLEMMKKTFDSKMYTVEDNMDYEYISLHSEGYTPLDLKKLCDKAIFEAWQRKAQGMDSLVITNEDIKLALQFSKPSALHQVNFYKGPKISWNDIGGLKSVKEKLIEVVCWSTMYPEIIGQCPVKPQTGVLLYGAPGTGKTLLAGALAAESRMNFISIKGPELMSKYIGESEEGVRKLFEKSQAAQPCLLFFDEFDSLAPRRGQDQTGVTDRVVNQLLTALDGVDPMSGVWVLAATSRPDLIDPAVLRPGRIGISVHCPLPNQEDRLEILKKFSSKVKLSGDVEMDELAEMTEGFTGADIKGLFTAAQIKALDAHQSDEALLSGEAETGNVELGVRREVLLAALGEIRPSLSDQERARYQRIYEQFEGRLPTPLHQQKLTHA